MANRRLVLTRGAAPVARRFDARTLALTGLVLPAALGMSGTALGKDTSDTSKGTPALEEVVVTATRRQMSILEVPQSITALSESTLVDSGFDNLSSFAGMVPSMNFTERGPGRTAITIRGVSADPGTQSVSTVGIYVDEVAITTDDQNSQADVRTFDLNRVEVLRGPQGTLYGEGAMGGVVRYITNKPDASAFSGTVDMAGASITGGDNDYSVNAAVNIPIVEDTLAIRLVGLYRDQGGYIDNPQIGAENFNSAKIKGGRASILWNATDKLSFTAMAMVNRIDVGGDNITNGGSETTFTAAALNPRTDDYDLYSLTATYQFAGFDLTSVTGYSRRQSVAQSVDSALALQYFVIPYSAPFSDVVPTSSTYLASVDNKNFTQELRAVSTGDGPFKWTAGLWYRKGDFENIGSRQVVPTLTYGGNGDLSTIGVPINLGPNPLGGPLGEPIPGSLHTDPSTSTFRNKAVFGEVSYDFNPQWGMLLGGRYFKETRGTDAPVGTGVINELLTLFGLAQPIDDEFSITAFTPKATVTYKPGEHSLTYLTFASGVRSGGRNGQVAPVRGNACPEFYQEDSTNNFEIGGNTEALDGRMVITGAVFYTKWNDLQVLFFDPTTFTSCKDNAGTAHTAGIELAVTTRLAEGLTLGIDGNYIEAELDEDIPGADSPTAVIPKGTRLPNVPKYKFGANLQYVWPWFGDWGGLFNVNFSTVGDSTAALEPGVRGSLEQPAYTIANARFGIQNGRWGAFVFVNNLTDEFAVFADDTFGGIHRNQPRTVGINLRANF